MNSFAVADFAPVSLPELVAEAELLTRFDRKYALRSCQVTELLRALDPRTRALTMDGRRRFGYESVYFDTPDLLSYRQAAHARRRRFKVRTRSYLDSDLTFLEVKVRGGREVTMKDRIPYRPTDWAQLSCLGREYAESILGSRGLDGSVAWRFVPTLTVGYLRSTLLPPEPGVRVTIDTNLAWTDGERGFAIPDLVILETKSDARGSGVDRLLWREGHRPVSLSKYGTGLAALRPDLPSNKWARVLRRHFHTIEELPWVA